MACALLSLSNGKVNPAGKENAIYMIVSGRLHQCTRCLGDEVDRVILLGVKKLGERCLNWTLEDSYVPDGERDTHRPLSAEGLAEANNNSKA
jgi:hypothetical protein